MSDFIEMVMQVDTPDGHRNVHRAYIYGSIQYIDRDPPLMIEGADELSKRLRPQHGCCE
jgi:hypothetical protein